MKFDDRDELTLKMAKEMYRAAGRVDWELESGAVRAEALRIANGFLDVLEPVMDDFGPWLVAVQDWYEKLKVS